MSDGGGMGGLSRWLIVFGIVLIVAGLLWPLLQKVGLDQIPGNIVVDRENFRLYLPLGTSLVISVVVSVLLWLFNK
jgi:hypothetical protein